MHKNIPYIPPVEERIERKISAVTSPSMCVLTVIAQIGTSLLISHLLAEYSSYVYALLLIAGAAVVLLHVWKRNNMLSIVGGTILYMVLVQAVF